MSPARTFSRALGALVVTLFFFAPWFGLTNLRTRFSVRPETAAELLVDRARFLIDWGITLPIRACFGGPQGDDAIRTVEGIWWIALWISLPACGLGLLLLPGRWSRVRITCTLIGTGVIAAILWRYVRTDRGVVGCHFEGSLGPYLMGWSVASVPLAFALLGICSVARHPQRLWLPIVALTGSTLLGLVMSYLPDQCHGLANHWSIGNWILGGTRAAMACFLVALMIEFTLARSYGWGTPSCLQTARTVPAAISRWRGNGARWPFARFT